MNSFEITKVSFFKRFWSAYLIYMFWLTVFMGVTLIKLEGNVLYGFLLFSPFYFFFLLRAVWVSYKYLYRIEIDNQNIIFYFQLIGKTSFIKQDILNTKIFFCKNIKSRSCILFGRRIKGYSFEESFCQYIICDWKTNYKDFAKFLNDNGIWNSYNEKVKL